MAGTEANDRSINPLNKPIHDFHIIMDALYPHAKPLSCVKNKRLDYSRMGHPVCYLLYEGHGTVHRQADGLVMSSMRAPGIIGISNIISPIESGYYWRAGKTCSILVVDADVAYQVISENDYWQSLSKILGFLINRLSEHSARLVAQNGYNLVCNQIIALMQEPVYIRQKVSLPKYIIDRTLLSRSYVMKILAELKQEGRITVVDKMLVEVNNLLGD